MLGPPEHADGVGVVFDERDALAQAYSFFLDGPTINLDDQVGEGYIGREIEEGLFFGIDKRILAAMVERPVSVIERRRRVAEVFEILSDQTQAYKGRRDRYVSPGPDGMIVVDQRPRRMIWRPQY